MKKEIKLCEKKVKYILRRSNRARRMRLVVCCDGNLVVTAPQGTDYLIVEKFILEKSRWILDKIKYFKDFPVKFSVRRGKKDYLKYKSRAYDLAGQRLEYFNQDYGFKFNRINIRNQKSRWGSCSRKGNLNFNYNIAFLPQNLADYIIVHELCHLGEFNHSKKFWHLVARAFPDFFNLRKELKSGV